MTNYDVIKALPAEGLARYVTGTVLDMLEKVGVSIDGEEYYQAYMKYLKMDFEEEKEIDGDKD